MTSFLYKKYNQEPNKLEHSSSSLETGQPPANFEIKNPDNKIFPSLNTGLLPWEPLTIKSDSNLEIMMSLF